MSRRQPSLLSSGQDDDFPAMKRKKPRQKKDVDKWNLLWFIPGNVLNNREVGAGGKQGKREGFNTYNRLACRGCRHAFHKTSGFRLHQCTGLSSFSARGTSKSSFSSSQSSTTKQSLGTRKSSRAAKPRFTLEDDDEIEIVGDTELDKKNEKRIDKNFSKMSLAGKLRAMEEYRASSLFVDEEGEEPAVVEVSKRKSRNAKNKAFMEKDNGDIEVIDIEEEDVISSPDDDEAYKTSNDEADSDDEIEILLDEISENKIMKVNFDDLEELEITVTKMPLSNEEKLLREDSDDSKKSDFIKVQSVSDKAMKVKRKKYENIQKALSMNTINISPMSTKCETKGTYEPKEGLVSEDVEIVELDDSLGCSPPSKRKTEEPTRISKRIRSRG